MTKKFSAAAKLIQTPSAGNQANAPKSNGSPAGAKKPWAPTVMTQKAPPPLVWKAYREWLMNDGCPDRYHG